MMIVVGGVAAAVQVLIFAMESLWWNRPAVRRRFRMSDAQAEASRLFAFNQGAYNLFLAVGIAVGLGLVAAGRPEWGRLLVGWNAASMVGAACVLLASAKGLWRGALFQGAPGALALVGAILGM
jgi:putative membrane protein